MSTKPAYQTDRAGHFVCITVADESPLEPGVFYPPAGAVMVSPPDEWPGDKWPRWNGHSWDLVTRPTPPAETDSNPVAKLQAFLSANPDVAELIGQGAV